MAEIDWIAFWLSAGVGFLLGIGASYLAWLVNFHWVVPSVEFSQEIARRPLTNGNTFYQIAFQNDGKRKMVDVDIVVRVGIKNFMGATGWGYHEIRTNASRVPDLSSGDESRRLIRVFDSRASMQFVDVPSPTIRDAMLGCSTLEELLQLGEDASVQVHVFGYDAFSGTRRHLPSKKYRKLDVRTGRFEGIVVVQDDKIGKYVNS